jgi:hypothetical protein
LNITQLTESDTRQGGAALYTYFDYDALNRLSAHRTKRQVSLPPMSASWVWVKRSHNCDAIGRLVKSNWKTWLDGGNEPGGDTSQHIYAGAKHIQNYDGTNYGAVWHWAGAQHEHMGPLRSPNADTASQTGYNVAAGGADESGGGGAGGMTPQRRTFLSPTSEGDQRHLFGQGRPMAKDSSGSGSNWANGTQSLPTTLGQSAVKSRLFFEGTVSSTDMTRATDAREKQRIGIFGTDLSYAESYGRLASESIGRDLNPLGKQVWQALLVSVLNLGTIPPRLPRAGYLRAMLDNSTCHVSGDDRDLPPLTVPDTECIEERKKVNTLHTRFNTLCGSDLGKHNLHDPERYFITLDPKDYPGNIIPDYCYVFADNVLRVLQRDIKLCNSKYWASIRDTCKDAQSCLPDLDKLLGVYCAAHEKWWDAYWECRMCRELNYSNPDVCKGVCEQAKKLEKEMELPWMRYAGKYLSCRLFVDTVSGMVHGLNACYALAMDKANRELASTSCPGYAEYIVIPPAQPWPWWLPVPLPYPMSQTYAF